MLENGNKICNCKRKKCVRHGKCSECIEYHKNSKSLPLPYCRGPKFDLLNKSLILHKWLVEWKIKTKEEKGNLNVYEKIIPFYKVQIWKQWN